MLDNNNNNNNNNNNPTDKYIINAKSVEGKPTLAAGNFTGITPGTKRFVPDAQGHYAEVYKEVGLNLFGNRANWDRIAWVNQSVPEIAWKSALGGAINAGAGILAGVASNDMRGATNMALGNVEAEYGNVLFEWSQELMEYAGKEFHIFDDGSDSIFSTSYWGKQLQNMGYSLGIIAEMFGEQYLLAMATAGLGNLAAAGGTAAKVANLASKVGKLALNPIVFGSYQGVKEGYLNGLHTGASVYQKYKDMGYSDEEAKRKANKAATYGFRMEVGPLMVLNALQWGALSKFASPFSKGSTFNPGFSGFMEGVFGGMLPKSMTKGIRGKLIDYGLQSTSEAFEEGYQTFVSKYAQYKVGDDSRKTIGEILLDDTEFRDSIIAGGAMGLIFRGLGGRMQYIQNSLAKNSKAKQLKTKTEKFIGGLSGTVGSHLKDLQETLAEGDLLKIEAIKAKLMSDMVAEAINYDLQNGNEKAFDAYISELENVINKINSTSSLEELKTLGITQENREEYLKNIQQYIQDAKKYKDVFVEEWRSNGKDVLASYNIASAEVGKDSLERFERKLKGTIDNLFEESGVTSDSVKKLIFHKLAALYTGQKASPKKRFSLWNRDQHRQHKEQVENLEERPMTKLDEESMINFMESQKVEDAFYLIAALKNVESGIEKSYSKISKWRNKKYIKRQKIKLAKKAIKDSKSAEALKDIRKNLFEQGILDDNLKEALEEREKQLEVAEDTQAKKSEESKEPKKSKKSKESKKSKGNTNVELEGDIFSMDTESTEENTGESTEEDPFKMSDEEMRSKTGNDKKTQSDIQDIIDASEDMQFEMKSEEDAERDIDYLMESLISKLEGKNNEDKFKRIVEKFIEHSGTEETKQKYNTLAKSYKRVTGTEFDSKKIYNDIFVSAKDLMSKIMDLANSKTENQEGAQQEEESESTESEIEDTNPNKTTTGALKAGHMDTLVGRTVEVVDGKLVVSEEDLGSGLYEDGPLNPKVMVNPNKLNPGEELTVRIPNDVRKYQINLYDENGVLLKRMSFGEWLDDNGYTREDDEYWEMVPLIAYTKDNEPVFFVHDLSWYNKVNIGFKDQPEVQKAVIKEGKENHRRLRNKIKNTTGNTTSVRIKSKEMGTFIYLDSDNLIPVHQTHPEARIGYVDSNKNIIVDGEIFEGEIWSNEEIPAGATVTIRQGPNKNMFVAHATTSPQLDKDTKDAIRLALTAYLFKGDPSKAPSEPRRRTIETANKVIEEIQRKTKNGNKTSGFDISKTKDLERFLGQYIVFRSSRDSVKDTVASINARYKNRLGKPYIFTLKGAVVVGVVGGEHIKMYPRETSPNNLNKALRMLFGTGHNSKGMYLEFTARRNKGENMVSFEQTETVEENEKGEQVKRVQISVRRTEDSYEDYMRKRLKTNVVSFNVGTKNNPVYATVVQPGIIYEPVKTVYEEFRETNRVPKEVIETIVNKLSNDLPLTPQEEEIYKAKKDEIIAQLDKLTTVEKLIEEADKLLFGENKIEDENLSLIQKYQIATFIMNEVLTIFDENREIPQNEVLKRIREAYDNITEERKERITRIINNLKSLEVENKRAQILIEGLEKQLTIISQVDENWEEIEGIALENIQKLTEISVGLIDMIETKSGKKFLENSYEENGMDSASYRIKRFLSGIKRTDANGKVVTGVLGIPLFIPFDEVFETVAKVSTSPTELDSDFDSIMNRLKENAATHTWLNQVIDKLENASGQEQNEFLYNFIKHAITMKFVMYSLTKNGKWVSKTYDTNANEIERGIIKQWESRFKAGGLVSAKNGEHQFNKERAKFLLEEFERLQEEVEKYRNHKRLYKRVRELAKEGKLPTEAIAKMGKNPTYKRILFVLVDYKEAFDIITNEEKNFENYLIGELQNWLADNSFGMPLHTNTIKSLLHNNFRYKPFNKKRKVNLNFKKSFQISKNTYNIFGALAYHLKEMVDAKDTSFEDNPHNDPFARHYNLLRSLAKEEVKYSTFTSVLSFRDAGKTLYGYSNTKLATDITKRLKLNKEFREKFANKEYNSESYLLKLLMENPDFRDLFWIDHLGLTAFKELGKKIFGSNKITNLPEVDHELTKLGLFQDMSNGEVESPDFPDMRVARMFFPTMSDKSQMLMLKTAVLNLQQNKHLVTNSKGEIEMTDELVEILYQQLVLPELKRIIHFNSVVGETNIKGYDKGASIFFNIPELNNIVDDEFGKRVTLLMRENPELYNLEWFEKNAKNTAKHMLKEHFKNNVEKKLSFWNKADIVSDEGPIKMDKTYLEKFDGDDFKKAEFAAWDYVINSYLTNANIFMLYIGDPAQYFTGGVNKYFINGNTTMPKEEYGNDAYAKMVDLEVNPNIEKRLAELLAPGSKLAGSVNQEYLQLFLEDYVDMSENIRKIIKTVYSEKKAESALKLLDEYESAETEEDKSKKLKELKDTYTEIQNYFEIETTDAQELTTISEHLHNMYSKGELSDEEYETMREKVLKQKAAEKKGKSIPKDAYLTNEELGLVLKPIKPVHTGFYDDTIFNVMRMIYIKSSSYPLIPQITQDLEIDGLRKLMESQEVLDKEGFPIKPVRASYQTANKVGAVTTPIKVFNEDGTFNEDISDDHISLGSLTLNRDNYRIQQETPDTFDEKTTSLVTQAMKLLLANGVGTANVEGFKFRDVEYNGEELNELYNIVFNNYIVEKKNILLKRLGYKEDGSFDNIERTIQVLQDILYEEAIKRGYSKQSVESLKITPILNSDGDAVDFQFQLPLWMSPNSDRFESLLNSIVTNQLINLKLPGRTYVIGSETGYKVKAEDELINKNRIVFTDKYEGELKSNQVLVSPNFTNNQGKLIRFINDDGTPNEEYVERDENGTLRLKEGKISEQLLSNSSFRVPNSGHGSMSQIEIVGFLPPEMDLLMIVPKNLVAQKGFDFDVDEEHVYREHSFVTKKGFIRPFEEDDVVNILSVIDRIGLSELSPESTTAKTIENILGKKFEVLKIQYRGREDALIERLQDKMILMLYENMIVEIHSSVLSNPNPEVQKKIFLGINTSFAENQADIIQSKISENKDYAGFSVLSDAYQRENLINAANGKLAISVYSANLAFNGLLQSAKDTISLTTHNKKGDVVPFNFFFGDIHIDGELGKIDTLVPNGNKSLQSTIAESLSERQNTGTDDVKLRVLSRVNINDITIGVDSLLTLLGVHKGKLKTDSTKENSGQEMSMSYLLLSQPIIRDYVRLMKQGQSNTLEYNPNSQQDVIDALSEKYGGEIKFDPMNTDSLTAQEMYDNLIRPDNHIQRLALGLFLELDSYSKELIPIQNLLNINSGGLGKSFFDVIDMKSSIEDIISGGSRFANIETLFGEILTKDEYAERFGTAPEEIFRDINKEKRRKKKKVKQNKILEGVPKELIKAFEEAKNRFTLIDLTKDQSFLLPPHMREEDDDTWDFSINTFFEVNDFYEDYVAPKVSKEFLVDLGMDESINYAEYRILGSYFKNDVYNIEVAFIDYKNDVTTETFQTKKEISFYIEKDTGEYYKRTTQNIYPEINPEERERSEFLEGSSVIGTGIDALVRDFFMGDVKSFGEYEVINTKEVYDNFIKQLQDLKQKFDERGETVLSDDIIVFDERQGYAGTVDLLTVDKEGKIRIYDMKTMRSNKFDEKYKGKDKPKLFTPFEEDGISDFEKYQKQLSAYAFALKNTYGLDVVETGIIPIKVYYPKNGLSTSEAEIIFGENDTESKERGFFKIDMLDEFESLDGKTITTLDNPTDPIEIGQSSDRVSTIKRYTVSDLRGNKDKIYVFGDNIQRQGKGGQAVIRNEENAFGIATKKKPATTEDSYMTDNEFEENKEIIDSDIQKILNDGRAVVFPEDGIGTGLAKLKEKAPKTYAYLKDQLLEKFGFNNDTGEVKINNYNQEQSIQEEENEALDKIKTQLRNLPDDIISEQNIEDILEYAENNFEEPILIFKGLDGKTDLKGNKVSVHDTPGYSWGSSSYSDALTYARKTERVSLTIVEGKDMIKYKAPSDLGVSEYRKNEEDFINNSGKDLIELDTSDGTTKLPQLVFKTKDAIGILNVSYPVELNIPSQQSSANLENISQEFDNPEESFEMFDGSDTSFQTGTVIRHRDKTFLVWKVGSGKSQLKLITPEGNIEPYSGTPNIFTIEDKGVGKFPVVRTNINETIVLDENTLISANSGKVLKTNTDLAKEAIQKAKNNKDVQYELFGNEDIEQSEFEDDSDKSSEYIRIGDYYIKPNSPVSSMLINSVNTGYNLWKNIFPYENDAIETTMSHILMELESNTEIASKRVSLRQHIFKEMKKYFVATPILGLFEGGAQYQRNRLFMERGNDNISLARYMQQLMDDNSDISKYLNSIKLISSLSYDTKKNGGVSLIKFNNTKADSFNEELLDMSLSMLMEKDIQLPPFNGEPYSTKKLAEDLIAYAYLEGGIQEAVQFVKYVPVSYLNSTSFSTIIRDWHRKQNFGEILGNFSKEVITIFEKQYYQHNPGRLYKVETNEIEYPEFSGGKSLNTLESFILSGDSSGVEKEFVAIYNEKLKGKKFQLYQRIGGRYERIPVLGTFGMSEYVLGDENVKSIVNPYRRDKDPENKITGNISDIEVNTYGILDQPIEDVLSQISNSTFSKYTHLSELADYLKKFVRSKGIEIKVEPIRDNNGRRIANGSYQSTLEGGIITIDDRYFKTASRENIARTVIHETIHALTKDYMNKYVNRDGSYKEGDKIPSEIEELVILFNRTKEVLGDRVEKMQEKRRKGQAVTNEEKEFVYAGTDIFEFVTLALVEPRFQKAMMDESYSSKKSIFDKFAEIINKILSSVFSDAYGEGNVTSESIANTLRVIENQNSMKMGTAIDEMHNTDNTIEGILGEDFNEDSFFTNTDYTESDMDFPFEVVSDEDVLNTIFSENERLYDVGTKDQFKEFLRDRGIGLLKVSKRDVKAFMNSIENSEENDNPLICNG